MSPKDIAYYRKRAVAERASAKAAARSDLADIHLQLACLYEKIVELDQPSGSPLRLVDVMHPSA